MKAWENRRVSQERKDNNSTIPAPRALQELQEKYISFYGMDTILGKDIKKERTGSPSLGSGRPGGLGLKLSLSAQGRLG